MATNTLILGLALAAPDSSAAPPKDPCALLKPAEVQALAPQAPIGKGVSSTVSAELGSFACQYEWGSGGNAASGRFQLQVILSNASQAFPGTEPAMIRQGLLAEARPGKASAAVIPGVGEAAVFTSDDPIRAQASAYAKGSLLQVILQGNGAREKKDQVVALLESAAARL